ncbi:hypothetical protein AO263_00130 [Pseudomonas sp. NZIPFR-PS5]|nr:hypothetical protein AO263_00130 [Pseudomonas sp. NZIPFR-PS5]
MKIQLLLVVLLLTASCSSDNRAVFNGEINSASDRSGAAVATALTSRYQDTRPNCGADSKPAFLCSGIDLRGTAEATTAFDAWNPSPTAVRVGGVSFSYLRSDYKMRRLAFDYTHGFIFYPVLSKPAGKITVKVLCFFPIDGQSDNRPEAGCGASANRPKSDRCHRVGVTTGEQWAKHYNDYGEHSAGGIGGCSMDVRDSANQYAGSNFYEGLRGGRLISPKTFEKPNDLKHETWAQNIPATLPIEAFFYTTPAGLASSRYDQKRFHTLTGIAIPIISVKLPSTLAADATFTFLPADQVVQIQ